MFDHQARHGRPIDQNDSRLQLIDIIACLPGEFRACNEDAFLCASSVQRADKLLNFRTPHRIGPLLDLNVDDVQAQFIFVDDAVDSFIAAPTHDLSSLRQAASVPHRNEEPDHQALEQRWICPAHLLQDAGDSGLRTQD
ncbi:hypothetical protein CP488_00343 [Chthonomonas calidirosea]|nr:hypothetical protein CP488_00343 [Chthonomonas calidirosea]